MTCQQLEKSSKLLRWGLVNHQNDDLGLYEWNVPQIYTSMTRILCNQINLETQSTDIKDGRKWFGIYGLDDVHSYSDISCDTISVDLQHSPLKEPNICNHHSAS